jgi:hypothetical protein
VPWTTTPTAVTAAGAPTAVVRPHRCPECACARCEATCSDGDGELSLQDNAGSVHPVLDTRRTTSRVGTDPMTPMTPMPYGLWDDEYVRRRRISAEAVTLLRWAQVRLVVYSCLLTASCGIQQLAIRSQHWPAGHSHQAQCIVGWNCTPRPLTSWH